MTKQTQIKRQKTNRKIITITKTDKDKYKDKYKDKDKDKGEACWYVL